MWVLQSTVTLRFQPDGSKQTVPPRIVVEDGEDSDEEGTRPTLSLHRSEVSTVHAIQR
jgi:hypothetical protein